MPSKQPYLITSNGRFLGRRRDSWIAIAYAKKIVQPNQVIRIYYDDFGSPSRLIEEITYDDRLYTHGTDCRRDADTAHSNDQPDLFSRPRQDPSSNS